MGTTNSRKFESNVVLHEADQPLDSISGLIRVRLNTKVDENTRAELEEDIAGLQGAIPEGSVQGHYRDKSELPLFGEDLLHSREFYEYVAYVNPGSQKPMLFSVSMNTQKSEASAKELEAFKSTIYSLTLLKP